MTDTLIDFKNLIETRLDIKSTLVIENDRLIPNKDLLNKKYIKEKCLDDLFSFHNGKLIFTNRMLHFVGEITDRRLLAGHYFLTERLYL